ncbi:MAG: cell division protein FtsQ/DivIB [Pseudomonadota bacterium]
MCVNGTVDKAGNKIVRQKPYLVLKLAEILYIAYYPFLILYFDGSVMFKDGKVIEGQRFQRQSDKPSRINFNSLSVFRRWFFRLSLILLVFLSGILAWQKCEDPTVFPVKHIKITGDFNRVKRDSLQQIILPFTEKGFLRLDSRQLKERLLQESWIDTVTIKRFWPGTLVVNFTIKKPVALIGNNDLLDAQGNIFSRGQVDPLSLDLPFFVGPLGQQKYLLQAYQIMQPLVLGLALKIKLLKLVDQQYWYLRLSNGLAVYLSRTEPDQQLRRFVEVYPDVIASKASMIDYVDLRYAHGMAVKFKRKVS